MGQHLALLTLIMTRALTRDITFWVKIIMKCHRCCSTVVYKKFYGPQEHFWGWRCTLCGEVIDQVILENRHWTKADRQNRDQVEGTD